MDRRQALRLISAVSGVALNVPAMEACFAAASSGTALVLVVLSQAQEALTATVAELIIPSTDTPGAREAGVSRFIDHMLAHWYTPQERAAFLKGLEGLDETARAQAGVPFVQLEPQRQVQLLTALEAASADPPVAGYPEDNPTFFQTLKFFTLVGYYTSEIGAQQELRTLIVPGRFRGSVPYAEIGRAWAEV